MCRGRIQRSLVKLLMILGGLCGFAMGLVLGLAQGSAWPGTFWRASVAALLGGLVLRWWGRLCLRSLAAAHRERHAADLKSNAKPAAARV